MRRAIFGLTAAVGFAVVVFYANSSIDQGKPGTQGSWPVAAVSGGWTPDGGYIGSFVGIQGTGIDGGLAWNVASGSASGGIKTWRLVGEVNLVAAFNDGGYIDAGTRLLVGFLDGGFGAEVAPAFQAAGAPPIARGFSWQQFPTAMRIESQWRGANVAIGLIYRMYESENAALQGAFVINYALGRGGTTAQNSSGDAVIGATVQPYGIGAIGSFAGTTRVFPTTPPFATIEINNGSSATPLTTLDAGVVRIYELR